MPPSDSLPSSGADHPIPVPGFAIRPATLADVPSILAVVRGFAADEIMLPISYGDAIERLRDFLLLYESDGGRVVGTVAVHVTWDDLVELRSLAVEKSLQGKGLGRALVDAALREARRLGAGTMFTLSYVPSFFEKMGFSVVDRHTLPHKVWLDCVKCPKFPDCGETALTIPLPPGRTTPPHNT